MGCIRKWIGHGDERINKSEIDKLMDEVFGSCKAMLENIAGQKVSHLNEYEDLANLRSPRVPKVYLKEVLEFLTEESKWFYNDIDNHVEDIWKLEKAALEVKQESQYGFSGLVSGLSGMCIKLQDVKAVLRYLRPIEGNE